MLTTFLADHTSAAAARRIDIAQRGWKPERTWGARAGGRWVATLLSDERRLTVPGGADLAVDALTAVTVAATHRRRGLMSGMIEQSLAAARERGDPLSVLIAAAWPIYGRFGYGPAALAANYRVDSRRAGHGIGDPSRLRQIDHAEAGEIAPSVFAAARAERAGQIDRPPVWWHRLLGLDGYAPDDELPPNWLVHEGDGGPDAVVAWKPAGEFGLAQPDGVVEVWDLATCGEVAYRDTWAYLCGVDNVREVTIRHRPLDEPIRWLLGDGRALVQTECVDFLWLCVLDVAAALSARRYTVSGELVLDVPGEGRYRLQADASGARCEATTGRADLELDRRALASIYLGGFRLRALTIGGGVRELTPGALDRADIMFSTSLAPWCATWF
jgi:predicted acetyltransferase